MLHWRPPKKTHAHARVHTHPSRGLRSVDYHSMLYNCHELKKKKAKRQMSSIRTQWKYSLTGLIVSSGVWRTQNLNSLKVSGKAYKVSFEPKVRTPHWHW